MYGIDLLEYSSKLRVLVEAEQSEDFDQSEVLLLIILDGFIRDQAYQLGKVANPYYDLNQRIIVLNQILGNINKILDTMQEHAVSMGCIHDLSLAASGFIKYLFAVSLNVNQILRSIEAGCNDRNAPATQAQASRKQKSTVTTKHC